MTGYTVRVKSEFTVNPPGNEFDVNPDSMGDYEQGEQIAEGVEEWLDNESDEVLADLFREQMQVIEVTRDDAGYPIYER